MQSVPPNVIPYLLGVPVLAIFSWRGYKNYLRLHNPLSGYFALSGFLATLAFACWSVPLLFTRNETALVILNSLGDLFLYALYVVSALLLYYLVIQGRMSKALFITPIVALSIIGWISDAYGYWHNGVRVVNNELTYTLPLLSSVIQVILLVNLLLVGVFLLGKVKEQNSSRGKSGLIAVAILYLLSAVAGIMNVVSTGHNDSPLILGAYTIGFIIFVFILIFVRTKKASTPSPPPPISS